MLGNWVLSITVWILNPPIHEVHGIWGPMRHSQLQRVFSAPCSRLSQLFFKPMYLRDKQNHRSGWLQRGILSAQQKHAKCSKSQNMNDSQDHTNLRCSSFSFWRYKQSKEFSSIPLEPRPNQQFMIRMFLSFLLFWGCLASKIPMLLGFSKGKILTHTGWPFGRWVCKRCIQGHILYIYILYNYITC